MRYLEGKRYMKIRTTGQEHRRGNRKKVRNTWRDEDRNSIAVSYVHPRMDFRE